MSTPSRKPLIAVRLLLIGGLALLLSACASYSGRGLIPGTSTLTEVVAVMGEPAMHWRDPDGREQLAYPRGPQGMQTYMVFVNADGRLDRIEAVLDAEHFYRIENGRDDQSSVLRLLGPSYPPWTAYFKARDELVWEWRFCDVSNEVAKFNVLFDGTTGIVRSSFQRKDRDNFVGFGRRGDMPYTCAR